MRILAIVPFLNEQTHIGRFLDSLAAQERIPDRLLLIDDGSTDGSPEVAAAFAARHPWAELHRRPARAPSRDRLAGGSAVRAFTWGLEQADDPWDIAVKMDADLALTPDVFAEIERRFVADPRLGMAGPYLSVTTDSGARVRQRCPAHHVEGPTKFYRRACYEQIGPLPAMLGWDTIDEIRAQMRGWETWSFAMPAGDPEHLRAMGSHDGRLRGFRRWGSCAYGYGEHPLHVLLVGMQKMRDRPRVLGGVHYVAGWMMAALRRMPRAEPELRAWVRREQLRRIRRRVRRSLGAAGAR